MLNCRSNQANIFVLQKKKKNDIKSDELQTFHQYVNVWTVRRIVCYDTINTRIAHTRAYWLQFCCSPIDDFRHSKQKKKKSFSRRVELYCSTTHMGFNEKCLYVVNKKIKLNYTIVRNNTHDLLGGTASTEKFY